jgi:phosphohistidine phosphatase SixA
MNSYVDDDLSAIAWETMVLTLVRHAHAGSKRRWTGPDEQRPLTERGLSEAHGIAQRLRAQPPYRLISSPLIRCRQTLEPVAAAYDLPIELTAALAPDAGLEETLALITDPAIDGCALCTHGEVLTRLLDRWRTDGSPRVPVDARTAKGGMWILSGYPGPRATARYGPSLRAELSLSGPAAPATRTWAG